MVHKFSPKKFDKWMDSEIIGELNKIPLGIRKSALKHDYAFETVYDNVHRKTVLRFTKSRFRRLLKKSVK